MIRLFTKKNRQEDISENLGNLSILEVQPTVENPKVKKNTPGSRKYHRAWLNIPEQELFEFVDSIKKKEASQQETLESAMKVLLAGLARKENTEREDLETNQTAD